MIADSVAASSLLLSAALLGTVGPGEIVHADDAETLKMAGADGIRLQLLHLPPTGGTDSRAAVLQIHGGTFPSALASGYRIEGRSWLDDLAARGFDVWAMDFAGFGGSDRFAAMAAPADANPPLLRASEATEQIAAAVAWIARRQGIDRVSLIAHSWGTVPAGLFAARHPKRVDRLVLFGPVAPRRASAQALPAGSDPGPAHHDITLEDQWASFQDGLPAGVPSQLGREAFERWGAAYLRTDVESGTRHPPSVRVPYGPIADFLAARRGDLPYRPERILAPTLVVRGEWDAVTSEEDLRWLYDRLTSAPERRAVTLDRGTHRLHLELAREALFAEVGAFLQRESGDSGEDRSPASGSRAPRGSASSGARDR